jgi:hypothetical protein
MNPAAMDLHLTDTALTVLEARYLKCDSSGKIVETPEALFQRVARSVAQAERTLGDSKAADRWEEAFREALTHLDFLPNSSTLMNVGSPLGQLSACFVLPVGDSIAEIFESLKLAALIQQSGGGTGFAFSRLRPQGDFVASTGGMASGPVSFMRIFDCATENVRQGGRRRGANMGVLRIDHPDIEAFIDAKRDGQSFRNFNLSKSCSREVWVGGAVSCLRSLHRPKRFEWVRQHAPDAFHFTRGDMFGEHREHRTGQLLGVDTGIVLEMLTQRRQEIRFVPRLDRCVGRRPAFVVESPHQQG